MNDQETSLEDTKDSRIGLGTGRKRWESGTVTSSSVKQRVEDGAGNIVDRPYVTVSNLTFRPSLVFINSVDRSYITDFTLYSSDYITQNNVDRYTQVFLASFS